MQPDEFEELLRQQNMMLRSVANESETDSKIKLLSIITSMTSSSRRRIQKEAVIIEAENEGMTMGEIDRVMTSLVQDRVIKETAGYVEIV